MEMTELIITEKPSAARKIAEALAEGKVEQKKDKVSYLEITRNKKKIKVVSAVGHLFTVDEKVKSFKYPSYDIEWKPSYLNEKSKHTKAYADVIKSQSKGIDSFIIACDYDVEGEVIGLNALKFLCGKKDAKRMKFSTLTKPDLIEAYDNLSPTINWGQAKAGETRHFLDWLYGINISRALTLAIKKASLYKVMSSGRVQGPSLKLLADKEREIRSFKPQKYWQVELVAKEPKLTAMHIKDKFDLEKDADKVLENTKGKSGIISGIEKSDIKQQPPFPFDLTTLQTESFRNFRITPKKTLDIAQELYTNGWISYPRTSSQQLTPKIGFKKIITELSKQKSYMPLAKMLLSKPALNPNNGKKTDPAHPAIYPTGIPPNKLEGQEFKVYDLIVKRFFSTFGDAAIRTSMTVNIDVNSEIFVARGITTKEKGWHVLYDPYSRQKEEELPIVSKGGKVLVKNIEKQEKETQPPKRYTQASLIKELEKRNLGTKSTRAQIIQSLIDRHYIDPKTMSVSEIGLKTIDTLEKYCPEIISEELTRHFEEEMQEIRENKKEPKETLEEAKTELTKMLGNFKKHELDIGNELVQSLKDTDKIKNTLGECPSCGKGNLMMKFSRKTKQRFIACDKYPDCKVIFNAPQLGLIKTIDKKCEHCSYPLVEIRNKRSAQVVCVNSNCKTRVVEESKSKKFPEEGMLCPNCNEGKMVLRKSFYGEFLGCNNYPKCKTMMKIVKGIVDKTPISGEKKK